MTIITGTKIKNGGFKMHAPTTKQIGRTFLGYTEKEMKKEYRKIYHLEGKHIEWYIV